MPPRKAKIQQRAIVQRFASRLRELRLSRGLTQAELARSAFVGTTYIGRLETGSTAPGIDLVDRLAESLGVSVADLLPAASVPDPAPLLREQANALLARLLASADVPTLQMVCPLLARLAESPTRRR